LGGPVGSDLGFPTANESDGGIGPSSRIATFSGADQPVIFWTPDHGAFVVRGAMKAAWDKLRGPAGKLGAPIGDQAVDGDRVWQQFTGGKISWNRAKNSFTTDPSNLAPALSGLQIPGQNQPSTVAVPPHGKKFTLQRWWLLAGVAVLVLVLLAALLGVVWRRRRRSRREAAGYEEHDTDAGYIAAVGGHWVDDDDADLATEYLPLDDRHPPEPEPPPDAGPAARVEWGRESGFAADPDEEAEPGVGYGGEAPSESRESASLFARPVATEEENPDAVDTDSIPVVSRAVLLQAGYPAVPEEAGYPEVPEEAGYPDVPAEAGYPDVAHEDAGYEDAGYADAGYADVAHEDAGYADAGYADAGYADAEYPVVIPHVPPGGAYLGHDPRDADETDAAYPDLAVPRAAADVGYPEAAAPEAHVEDTVVPDAVAPSAEPRTGRHAAVDADDGSEAADPAYPERPTIHLPLDDPYQVPEGYPIKASARFGLYYTPGSELYHDTLAEIWLASEEVARANGFVKAD
jgi:uncharacterized protein with LGFP repeats